MTPRPTPADYAEADLCMAELAKRADADWHQRHHDDNRDGFATAAMQRRQHAEWLQGRALNEAPAQRVAANVSRRAA